MSEHYYVHQNAEVIDKTADDHGFQGDTFWWKIDRHRRTCTDEETGIVYPIAADLFLGTYAEMTT